MATIAQELYALQLAPDELALIAGRRAVAYKDTRPETMYVFEDGSVISSKYGARIVEDPQDFHRWRLRQLQRTDNNEETK